MADGRSERDRLKAVLLGARAGTWHVQVDPPQLLWDEGWRELYGFSPDEATSEEKWRARLHPEDLPRIEEQFARGLGGLSDQWVQDFRVLHPVLGLRWIHDRVEVRRDAGGRPVSYGGLNFDVTERKLAEAGLRESEERLRLAHQAAGLGSWEWRPDGGVVWSPRAMELAGLDPEKPATVQDLFSRILPEDRPAVEAALARAADPSGDGSYAVEFRVTAQDGSTRWLQDVGRMVFEGEDGARRPERMLGVVRDVTQAKAAEEQIRLLMAEVNHRSKNLLAVVQSVARQTASRSEPGEFARRFSERLEGLAASHDLLVASLWQGIGLEELVRSQLSHVRDLVGSRIVLGGPPLNLCAAAAQAIGMALHELATNASKYGALSAAEGQVEVCWDLLEEGGKPNVCLCWRESGGPPVSPPVRRGFGSTVMVRMAELALSGEVRLDHRPEGVAWRMTAPASKVLEARPLDGAGRKKGIA